MKINKIASANFNGKVNIKTADNSGRMYLYNEILAITNEFKIPANFKTHEIQLPSVTEEIIKRLKDLKIVYTELVETNKNK